MADNNKENMDDDILRSRKDILQAQNLQKKANDAEQKTDSSKEKNSSHISDNKGRESHDDVDKKQTEHKKIEKKASPDSEKPPQPKTEIPQFNLAEQIMSEQRKITSARRTPPEQNMGSLHHIPHKDEGHGITSKPVSKPYKSKIISQIVSRDIEEIFRTEK